MRRRCSFAPERAILKRAGASWDDVVDITSFHTDVSTQMPAIVAAHKKYVKAPYPAWTAVGTTGLLADTGIVEVQMIAHIPAKK